MDGLAAADGGGANPDLSVPPEYEQLKHCIALDRQPIGNNRHATCMSHVTDALYSLWRITQSPTPLSHRGDPAVRHQQREPAGHHPEADNTCPPTTPAGTSAGPLSQEPMCFPAPVTYCT